MEYHYLMAGILGSWFGFLFLCSFFMMGKKKSGGDFKRVAEEEEEDVKKDLKELVKSSGAAVDGICRDDEAEGSTEVIIVGAGVAGAALAYTLAKVKSSLAFYIRYGLRRIPRLPFFS